MFACRWRALLLDIVGALSLDRVGLRNACYGALRPDMLLGCLLIIDR